MSRRANLLRKLRRLEEMKRTIRIIELHPGRRGQDGDYRHLGQAEATAGERAGKAAPPAKDGEMWELCERCGQRALHRSGPPGLEIAVCLRCESSVPRG
jgi:hypothetical protein